PTPYGVQVALELADPVTQENRWAGKDSVKAADISRLASNIAQKLAQAIHAEIAPDKQGRLSTRRSAKPEAYNAFIRALQKFERYTVGTDVPSREEFRRVSALDSSFADPFAYLAITSEYLVLNSNNPLSAAASSSLHATADSAARRA